MIIKSISGDGKIKFTNVGGIDPLTVLGQRAHIQAGEDVIHGVITTMDMIDGNLIEIMPTTNDMFIDTGLTREELQEKGVDIGTFIDLDQESGRLGNKDVIYGKALDDRIGCYALIEVAKRIKKTCEVAFVFTVQEEIGLYGAVTSAYELSPDMAIAVDVINSYDGRGLRSIGCGPTYTIKDAETA